MIEVTAIKFEPAAYVTKALLIMRTGISGRMRPCLSAIRKKVYHLLRTFC